MNSTATLPIPPPVVEEPLQIVLTYDHPVMAAAARAMIESRISQWAPGVDSHRDEWSFEEMEHPQFRAEAIELAKHCHILIIALTGVYELSEAFVQWLRAWSRLRAGTDTALILCTSQNGAAIRDSAECAMLPELARQNGMSFFATSVPTPAIQIAFAESPRQLLARLGALHAEGLPEFSLLND